MKSGHGSKPQMEKYKIPVVPHKAVAEVSKTVNLWERLVVVNRGWESKNTDGSNCLTV